MGATRKVGRRPVGFLAGIVEADENVVAFQVTVDDLLAVQRFDGPKEFNGQPHRERFFQAAAVAGLEPGNVDQVEECALVAIFFYQEAFVTVKMHLVRSNDRFSSTTDAEAAVGLA